LGNLSDFAGKKVVLEWTNHGCPYVVKHYATGNMQKIQKLATAEDDTVWLSVISSAPGKQGYVTGEQANALTTSRDAAPSAVVTIIVLFVNQQSRMQKIMSLQP